jgi:hypothetical protein
VKAVLLVAALSLAVTASARAQAVTALAHVVITGGPAPGTYDLSVTRAGCSSGATGKGSFGTQISDIKATPTALGSVQIIVPTPSASGSSVFEVLVRIGSLLKKTAEFEVNNLPAAKPTGGSGSVKVADAGATAKVSFDVTTKDGVHLVGTVDCKSVVRM